MRQRPGLPRMLAAVTDVTPKRDEAPPPPRSGEPPEPAVPSGGADHWYALDQAAVLAKVGSDAEQGLTAAEAASRLSQHGRNQITGEQPPSVWQVALGQVRDPMNIMLIAV